MTIRIKRIYDPVDVDDGARVLVDGIWPRGVSKERAQLHSWRKDVSPSTELRKWFDHELPRWPEFRERYRAELKLNHGIDELLALLAQGPLTLLYSARDLEHNQAVVLAELLQERCR